MNMTSLQQRIVIKELACGGESDRKIAKKLEISIATVRKWRRRSKGRKNAELHSQMGRPVKGALSSFPQGLVSTLSTWRKEHPGWGPTTLHVELEQDESYKGKRLPSESSITRWLKQEDLARPYEKHQDLPKTCASPTQACHEEWEMDARGQEKIPDIGVIALINVNDVFSKAKIMSYPCWLGDQRATRHPTRQDYQTLLRLSFVEWGLPDRLAVDHDSVFFDNLSKSPFPTHFHLWLVALGIELSFGRMGRPTDQAMTERSHQTWQHQVLDGQRFFEPSQLFRVLNERRQWLNYLMPCVSLDKVPPLVAHPQAKIPRQRYRPEWEADLLQLPRVYAYLSQGHWFRKGSSAGTVSLGTQVYYLGTEWRRTEVEITFDVQDLQLCFQTKSLDKRLPLRGITIPDLIGDASALLHLQDFQPALPFTQDQWLQLYSDHLLTSTI